MNHGDAFNDMPEEYKEYKQLSAVAYKDKSETDKAIADGKPRWIHHENSGWKCVVIKERGLGRQGNYLAIKDVPGNAHDYAINEVFLLEVLPHGEMPPPAVPEKPGAVASVLFQYDGGEWLHMAENISIDNPPYEGMGPKGDWIYIASPHFYITIDGHGLGLVPEMPGIGRLKVVMLDNETIYEGEGRVDGRHDNREDGRPFTESITFSMTRDEATPYIPDPLPDGLPTLNRCPDCDNTLEQRSVPDGIEEWCNECNMRVEMVDATDLEAAIREAAPELVDRMRDLVHVLEHWVSSDETWNIHKRKFYNAIDLLHKLGVPNVAEWYVDNGKDAAEGPMHPDMIRAELQKAIDGGYRMDIYPKAEYPQLKSRGKLIKEIVGGMVAMHTESAGLSAYMNLDMIQSVKPYRTGE